MKPWKYALRAVTRRPAFSLSVISLLTIGIAANTALFTLADTVLWKPLPYPQPQQLVTLMEASSAQNQKESLVAPQRLEDWNRLSRAFTAIAGSYTENVTDTSGSEPERLSGRRVSPRYFDVFAARPVLGRTFTSEEERFGGPPAAVISYGVWSRRYGQDPQVIGRRLLIGGGGFSIVGIMPKEFAAGPVDVWIPAQHPPFLMRQRGARFYSGIGRMKPGVTREQAHADLVSVQQALGEQFPATDKGWSVIVQGMKTARIGSSAKPLVLLLGAVLMVLLITVSNVAGLVVAQLHQRERELAVRASIGASRGQVVASVMREIALIATAGALGGWALASALIRVLVAAFAGLPRIAEIAMDWRAVVFALAASAISAFGFGFMPVLHATGPKHAPSLLRAGRGIVGKRQRVQRTLVAVQMALTMALLAGAGLFARSFFNLNHVDLGFDPSRTLLFHVGAAWDEDRSRVGRMQERLLADLQHLPGVEAAGITNFLPASGATLRYDVRLEGAARSEDQGRMPAGERTVSPGYLKALRTPLLAGNWCPELRLDAKAPPKAMVNRRFVEVYARGENVIGRHVRLENVPMEIVGVVGDQKEDAVAAPVYPYVYYCAMAGNWPDPEYAVRTSQDPHALLPSVRQLVHNSEPNRAIFGVQTLEDALAEDLDQPRSNVRLLALFAIAALVLAAVGLYGLVTQIVNARRQEIGIRMAIGADPARIVRSIVAGAGRLLSAGMAIGLALVLAAQPLVRSLLFGVSALDALSVVGAASLLATVALIAAFVPARRAAGIDPIETLRAE